MTKHASLARTLVVAAAATLAGACTMKSQEAPPLSGPSEYAMSVTLAVAPDVLTQDGASQSLVTIVTRDANGAVVRNVSLRAEISIGGVIADFGTLSARNLVTDASGHATLVYTAPVASSGPSVDTGTVVDIVITPIGSDYNNSRPRVVSIRLVPPGIIVPPDGLQPAFVFSPDTPTDNQTVLFDASTSKAPANNPIAAYRWDFGDGETGTGVTTTHSYSLSGTYAARLTISDAIGRSASTSKTVNVGLGAAPTALFTFSPADPLVGQQVNFNGAGSKAGVGRTIASYFWDFGDGDQKTTAAPLTSHDFIAAGTYTVTLVVTDDAGRTGAATTNVEVLSDAPVADFTFSPATPSAGTVVNFNSTTSTPSPGRTITSYFWNFGDGATSTAATPTHAFAVVGDYNVVLIITDSAGKTGRVTKTVNVK